MTERRYDADWLRVFAMLGVFIFHCTRFFCVEGWHLKNADQSFVLFVLVRGLMSPWLMEIFFVLSGVGAWYALQSRSAKTFLGERVKRLLVPLYTVGLLVLLPPQFYFDIMTNEGFTGTFRESLPRYFGEFYWPHLSRWPSTFLPIPFGGHLWFLQYLFLISLVALPLLVFLKSSRGRGAIDALAGWCARRGGIFALAIPLAVVLIVFRAMFHTGRGWAEFFWYAIYFVLGFLIPADGRFTEAFKRCRWIGLALWILGFFVGVAAFVLVLGYDPETGKEPFSLRFVVFQVLWALASLGSIVWILGMGARHLDFNHRYLARANEAVLPFYIFHQTIILCVGYYVIRWNLGIGAKYFIIAPASFILIVALYELLVRPFNVMRFLFGMKARPPRAGS